VKGSREFLDFFRRGSRSWRVYVGFGEGSRRVGERNLDFVIFLKGNFFLPGKNMIYFILKRKE